MNKPPHPGMARPDQPFLPPRRLPIGLARLQSYWNDLRRAENALPFSDDVNLSALPELSGNLVLVEVFDRPRRFRVNGVGQKLPKGSDASIMGSFADEIDPCHPFEFLLAQASVTVEASSPTFYRRGTTGAKADGGMGYARLLLPTWAGGRVDMLIGAIV
jgi:hypothetical protein